MPGHVDSINRGSILGWAADPANPTTEVELMVVVNGRPAGRFQANRQRDSLRRLFPGATGQYAFHYVFAQPLSLFETHVVEVLACQSGERLANGRKVIPKICSDRAVSGREPPPVQPILVTSLGRSGSSLCMARLAAHPKIVVAGDFPHEMLLVSYYALCLRTLASETDRLRSMKPAVMMGREHLFSVGFNPFNPGVTARDPTLTDYWNNQVPGRLTSAFSALICDYYAAIKGSSNKPLVRFFAEKAQVNELPRNAARMMFGVVREIVLIRDPRDLACSYRAFWKLDLATAVETIRVHLEALRRLREQNPPETLFVRYEELIRPQDTTMSRIWDFLGLEPPAASAASAEQALFERHGTSASPERSIGRWRNDLSAAEMELCQEKFGPILESFGFDRQ